MIKVLNATAQDGKVTINGLTPDDVKLTVAGEAASSGFLVVAEDNSLYIANTQPDLQQVIEQLKQVCEQLKTIGNNFYVTDVVEHAAVKTQPLASVATAAEQIEQTLNEMELI